jgi:hypothetical protein
MAPVCVICDADGYNCEEEFDNCFENDGSPDNSPWTSIATDGIPETSPSVDEGNPGDATDVEI